LAITRRTPGAHRAVPLLCVVGLDAGRESAGGAHEREALCQLLFEERGDIERRRWGGGQVGVFRVGAGAHFVFSHRIDIGTAKANSQEIIEHIKVKIFL
jgi:hypothetical protein